MKPETASLTFNPASTIISKIQFSASSVLAMLSHLVLVVLTAAQGEAWVPPWDSCRTDADCTLGRVALENTFFRWLDPNQTYVMINQTNHSVHLWWQATSAIPYTRFTRLAYQNNCLSCRQCHHPCHLGQLGNFAMKMWIARQDGDVEIRFWELVLVAGASR